MGKVVNGQFKKGWLYQDQLNPVAELDSAGNIIARFVYGTKGHVPDYMVKNDSTYRFITDHLGSVRLVVNVETGFIAQRLDYDEFGNVLVNTNEGFQPFGYAGGLFDEQTGLVRFGARDYDAVTGRWTAKDPVGFSWSNNNFYLYSNSEPIQHIDPHGYQAELAVGWGIALLEPSPVGEVIMAGVTIGVAATILYSEISDIVDDWDWWEENVGKPIPPPKDPCDIARERCISLCTNKHVGKMKKCDQGIPFHKCYSECMEEAGCLGK